MHAVKKSYQAIVEVHDAVLTTGVLRVAVCDVLLQIVIVHSLPVVAYDDVGQLVTLVEHEVQIHLPGLVLRVALCSCTRFKSSY
jgi:hypothetical protein